MSKPKVGGSKPRVGGHAASHGRFPSEFFYHPGYLNLPPATRTFLQSLHCSGGHYPPGLLPLGLGTLEDEIGYPRDTMLAFLDELEQDGFIKREDGIPFAILYAAGYSPRSPSQAKGWLGRAGTMPDCRLAGEYFEGLLEMVEGKKYLEEALAFNRGDWVAGKTKPSDDAQALAEVYLNLMERLRRLQKEFAPAEESENVTDSITLENTPETDRDRISESVSARSPKSESVSALSSEIDSISTVEPEENQEKIIPIEGEKGRRRVEKPSPPPTLLAEVFEHLQDNLPKEIQRDAAPLASSGSKLQKLWLEGESIDRIKASIDAFEVADWQPAIAKKWLQAMKALAGNKNLLAIARQAKISDFSSRSITLDFIGTTSADYVRDEENFGRPIREAFKNAWGRVEIVLEGEEQTAGA